MYSENMSLRRPLWPSSNYGAPSYYSPPASGVPAPGSASGTHYGDWDGDYEDEDYDDEDESNSNSNNNSNTNNNGKKSAGGGKTNSISSKPKPEEPPSYGTNTWWETSYPNFPAPPTSNTWYKFKNAWWPKLTLLEFCYLNSSNISTSLRKQLS